MSDWFNRETRIGRSFYPLRAMAVVAAAGALTSVALVLLLVAGAQRVSG